jgi:hypothetical protein
VSGSARAFVSHAARIGAREPSDRARRASARRRVGAHKRADGVGRGVAPVQQEAESGARYEYGPDDDWYDVPRGCLEHATCANLLAAGRCLSASHEAMGSARVIGTCLAVGEAAGRLAAERAG